MQSGQGVGCLSPMPHLKPSPSLHSLSMYDLILHNLTRKWGAYHLSYMCVNHFASPLQSRQDLGRSSQTTYSDFEIPRYQDHFLLHVTRHSISLYSSKRVDLVFFIRPLSHITAQIVVQQVGFYTSFLWVDFCFSITNSNTFKSPPQDLPTILPYQKHLVLPNSKTKSAHWQLKHKHLATHGRVRMIDRHRVITI
jgi:hypothetical protein